MKDSWFRIYEPLRLSDLKAVKQFTIETKDYGYLALPDYNKLRAGKKPSYSVQVITDTFVPSTGGMKLYRSFKKHDGSVTKDIKDLSFSAVLKRLNTAIEVQDMCLLNSGVFKDGNGKVISVVVKGNTVGLQSYKMHKKTSPKVKKSKDACERMMGEVDVKKWWETMVR